jgi:hypothetical protein
MKLQFRLRSLLIVVTIVCATSGWLANQARVAWERRAMLDRLVGGYSVDDDGAGISWVRHQFGDQGIGLIEFDVSMTNDELDRYRTAFPEACIYRTPGAPPIPRSSWPLDIPRSLWVRRRRT